MAKRRRKGGLGRGPGGGKGRPNGAGRASRFAGHRTVLGALIEGNEAVLEVLDKHGVTFCPGCYLTLFSSPERAAVYHAVPDVKAFLRELKAAARSRR